MRKMLPSLLAVALLSGPGLLIGQQQQSTQTSPNPTDPTKNNPDVPHQTPGTNNPDVAPEHQPAPGGTGVPAKKSKRRKNTSTNSTDTTSTHQ